MTFAELISPNLENISWSFSSVSISSPKFLTKTLVNIFAFSPNCFSLSFLGTNLPTKTFFPFRSMPLTLFMAWVADSSASKWTKPYPFEFPSSSWATLQDKMLPKVEKVSYMILLSIDLSKFLIKMLPTPDFLRLGSLWDHMIRMGRPLMTSKFIVSSARSVNQINHVSWLCSRTKYSPRNINCAVNDLPAKAVFPSGGCWKLT